MPHPKSDVELAAKLGTDRKSLRRWRTQFPADCPKDRNVAAWRKFIEDNQLGPFSARMRGTSPPANPHADPRAETTHRDWPDQAYRRQAIFALWDILESAFYDARLPLGDFIRIGTATTKHLIAIGRLWSAGIDEDGFRRRTREVFAAEVEKLAGK